jgi:hypothetical protein
MWLPFFVGARAHGAGCLAWETASTGEQEMQRGSAFKRPMRRKATDREFHERAVGTER